MNEVVAAFVQDKVALERGLFDDELVPEELTQIRMGKIVRDKYPMLDAEDQEAVRQHAIAALNLNQQVKQHLNEGGSAIGQVDSEQTGSTAFIQGVRKYAMNVRDLDMDLIDRINPFSEAYAILAKAMDENSLKQVAAIIAAKNVSMSIEEAREMAKRAVQFKQERGRLPAINATDPWEQKMAQGVAFLARMKAEAARNG